jgi:hypothetical protein
MMLPELSSRLDAAVDRFELFELDGQRSLAVVVKHRYRWNDRGKLEKSHDAAVRFADEPWDKSTSPRLPSDVFLRKPSTDIVVAASAVGPDRGVTELDAGLEVGGVKKFVRVFGPRVWYRGMGSMVLTPPQSFVQVALKWEEAFGGLDASDPKRSVHEPRNPVGGGIACDPSTLEHAPGPRIEDPTELITSARSRPKPAGLAALGPDFMPRRGYAGTFDQRWQDERMPLLPIDFNERFNQVAADGLVTPQHLRGGEPARLLNLGRHGATALVLPKHAFAMTVVRDDASEEAQRLDLDTVLFEADDRVVELAWRTSVVIARGRRAPRSLLVYEKRFV